MGGTTDIKINSPSNLMAICGSGTTGCHGWLESHREVAYEKGWLVHRYDSPADIEVEIKQGGVTLRLLLNEDGGYSYPEPNPS